MKPFDTEETDRLLMTTKAVRRRLDLTRPVEREKIVDCIRLAAYTPNASNAQDWRWVVVDDPEVRKAAGEQYRKMTVPPVSKMLESKLARGDEAGARISRSIIYLAERMADVPVLVFPCYDKEPAAERYDQLPGPRLVAPRDGLREVRVDLSGGVELSAGAAQPRAGLGADNGPPG